MDLASVHRIKLRLLLIVQHKFYWRIWGRQLKLQTGRGPWTGMCLAQRSHRQQRRGSRHSRCLRGFPAAASRREIGTPPPAGPTASASCPTTPCTGSARCWWSSRPRRRFHGYWLREQEQVHRGLLWGSENCHQTFVNLINIWDFREFWPQNNFVPSHTEDKSHTAWEELRAFTGHWNSSPVDGHGGFLRPQVPQFDAAVCRDGGHSLALRVEPTSSDEGAVKIWLAKQTHAHWRSQEYYCRLGNM